MQNKSTEEPHARTQETSSDPVERALERLKEAARPIFEDLRRDLSLSSDAVRFLTDGQTQVALQDLKDEFVPSKVATVEALKQYIEPDRSHNSIFIVGAQARDRLTLYGQLLEANKISSVTTFSLGYNGDDVRED